MRMIDNDRILKAISVLGFFLLAVVIILVLLDGPATGYELSIYESLPWESWLCMCVSVALGFGIGIQQTLSQSTRRNTWWVVGLALVLGNNLVFLLLPALRGYVLYGREDVMTHVGYSVDIVRTGFLTAKDVYPIQHLLVAILSMVTNLSPLVISIYLTPLLSLLYAGFIFCLARSVFDDLRLVRLATLFSTVLLFSPMQYHSWLSPAGIGVLLMPFIVYVFLKNLISSSVEFSIAAVLVAGIMLPFLHPLIWLVSTVTLLAIGLTIGFVQQRIVAASVRYKVRLGVVEISAIIFLTWFLSFYLAERLIKLVYERFFGSGLDLTMMERVLQSAEKVGLQWLDVAILTIKICGHDFIYIIFCVITAIFIILKVLKGQKGKVEVNLFILVTTFICPGLFFLAHLFTTVVEFGVLRLVTTMVACAPLFVAYALRGLGRSFQIESRSKFLAKISSLPTMFVILLACLCWIFGVASSFGWRFIRLPNQQVTRMDITGVAWLIEHRDPTVSADLNRMVSRLADGIFGTGWRAAQGIYRVTGTTSPIGALPDHFARSSDRRLGEHFERDVYMPISMYDQVLHTIFFPEFEQFDQSDFEALYYDTTVSRVFTNGEFDMWYVQSISNGNESNE